MKTPPDETTLTLWMDGLLEGEELQNLEAWAKENPELLAERDALQTMNQDIQVLVPSSVEPPYPDFFNQRIMNALAEEIPVEEAAPEQSRGGIWSMLAAPLAAGAMAFCFYLGTQISSPQTRTTYKAVAAVESTVYTPDTGVQADIFVDSTQEATIIVLEGLQDIPDDLEMAGGPNTGDPNRILVNTQETY